MLGRKKQKIVHERSDLFDRLTDDIVILILCALCSTARHPSDFICILLTSKRLNKLGLDPLVLCRVSSKALAIRAKNWSEHAHRFLKRCVYAGSAEACYTLGMIRFYCLEYRRSGLALITKAANASHAPALYSLAVIQFNSSGRSKNEKDIRAGVALCARAAAFDHSDAIRELGHCFADGYGVRKSVAEGRRLIIKANALEIKSVLRARDPSVHNQRKWNIQLGSPGSGSGSSLVSEFRRSLREPHPTNRFLSEWFGSREAGSHQGLRLCSYAGCGRPETRLNEFRRCSYCGRVNYCSRACQAQDWMLGHDVACLPMILAADGTGDGEQIEPMADIQEAANSDGDENDRVAEVEEASDGDGDEELDDDEDDQMAEIIEVANNGDGNKAQKNDRMEEIEVAANSDGRKDHKNDLVAEIEVAANSDGCKDHKNDLVAAYSDGCKDHKAAIEEAMVEIVAC